MTNEAGREALFEKWYKSYTDYLDFNPGQVCCAKNMMDTWQACDTAWRERLQSEEMVERCLVAIKRFNHTAHEQGAETFARGVACSVLGAILEGME